MVVCDLGAGFGATVLSRTGDGFEVLSSVDAPAGGGDAMDAAVAVCVGGGARLPVVAARYAPDDVPASAQDRPAGES